MNSISFARLPEETLLMILSYSDISTLYACIRLSRLIFSLAAPLLWFDLPDAGYLLNLMLIDAAQDINTVMSRWNIYGPLVRHLQVGRLFITSSQYKILLDYVKNKERPLLPNLLSLSMHPSVQDIAAGSALAKAPRRGRRTTATETQQLPPNFIFSMHFVMLAIGPCLRTLDIAYTGATIPNFDLILKERAPLISLLSITGAASNLCRSPCNHYLCGDGTHIEEQQTQLGYSRPERHIFPVDDDNDIYTAVDFVIIPARKEYLAGFTTIQSLTLFGQAFKHANLISLGCLPNLNTLILQDISAKDHPASLWNSYPNCKDEELFPLLRNFLLQQTGSHVASLVFSARFMLHGVHCITWESSERWTTESLHGEVLDTLSHNASSLNSLNLTLPTYVDTPDQRSNIFQVMSQLWPLGSISTLTEVDQIRICYLKACD